MAQIIKKIALALFYILVYFTFLYLFTLQAGLLEEDAENFSGVITIVASLSALGIYAVTFYLRGIRVNKYIEFKGVSLTDVVLSFAMAVGFRLLTGVYLMWSEENVEILRKSIESSQHSYNFNTMTPFCTVTVILSVCVAAPFLEEILFRGIIQNEFCEVMPVFFAVIMQGILFGAAHAVLAQTVFAAAYGIILGMIYYKTKNIMISVLGHMFFNLSSALEIKSPEALIKMFTTGLFLTGASIIVFFYIYQRKTPVITGDVTGGSENV